MPRNGSGQYDLPYNWNTDKTDGIKVLASRMQTQDQDIANALTSSVSADGQTPMTGDLDLNNNKVVDLADGEDAGDGVNVSQAQTGEFQYFGVSTTTPAGTNGLNYDLGPTPTIAVYPPYVSFSFTCHFTCIASPNARFGGLATKSLVKSNGVSGYTALVAGDMVADKEYNCIYNEDISSSNIIVLNPEVEGVINSGTAQARTIATGAISVDSSHSTYAVDTESSAATDDLDTISSGFDGQVIFLRSTNDARDIVVKHNVGNIYNPNGFDITLFTTNDLVELRYNSTLAKWTIISASTFGSSDSYLVSSQTASGAASIIFNNLSSQFKVYEFEFINVYPSNNGAALVMQFSLDGGSTWQNNSYLSDGILDTTAASAVESPNNARGPNLSLGDSYPNNNISNSSTLGGLTGWAKVYNPSSSVYKQFHYRTVNIMYIDGNTLSNAQGFGIWKGTNPVNAIRFIFKAANSDTGNGNINGTINMRGKL